MEEEFDMGTDVDTVDADTSSDCDGAVDDDCGAELATDEGVDLNDAEPEVSPEAANEEAEAEDRNSLSDEYGSSFDDRVKQTPISNGEWEGQRGDSLWRPETEDVAEILESYGADGIEYRNGFPDYTPVSEFEIELPEELYESKDMVQFEDCNMALSYYVENDADFASRFDEDQLEAIEIGKTPANYTWHHDVTPGRMQLVPTRIHQNCGHYGGKNIWGGGTANR